MGGPIDMKIDVIWETPMDFLKSVVLQFFPKYSQSFFCSTFDIQIGVLVFSIWM